MNKYVNRQYDQETLDHLQKVLTDVLADYVEVCEQYGLEYYMTGGSAIGVVRHGGFIPWDDDVDVCMPRSDYERFLEIMPEAMGEKYELLTPLLNSEYACNVTHLMLKGTTFIPYSNKDMNCHIGIYIDIFPMDTVPTGRKRRNIQLRRTWFLNKLLFLCGTPNPDIPLKGASKIVAEVICKSTHYLLKAQHVSPAFVYRLLEKESTKYNNRPTGYTNSFRSATGYKTYISDKELYPMTTGKFGDLTVKLPGNYDVFLTRMYGDYMQVPPVDQQINHVAYELDFGDY